MNKFLSAALLMFTLGAPLPALAQDATDEAAIRAIIAEQVVAWNAGDGTRYASHLAPEVSFTNLFGMVMYGAPAFASRHNEILSTFYSLSRGICLAVTMKLPSRPQQYPHLLQRPHPLLAQQPCKRLCR